jgi:pimeloyl-ACP methyl ester carboxylesterase
MSGIRTDEFKVQLPGGSVHVNKWTPEAPVSETPLILLHDSRGSVALWGDFPRILAATLSRSVLAYDRLGFGRSAPRVEIPSVHFIEEEATQYFPHIKKGLAIHRYILLGHSVGGSMSINIAACDPDCTAVITIAAQAYVETRTFDAIKDARDMFARAGQIERLQKWHGAKAQWVLRAWTGVWLSPGFSTWSLRTCIGKVACPVLAIHGDHDEYGSNAFPEFIAGTTAGAGKMLIVKDCGHMPHKEKQDEVVNAVKAFLAENPTR